MSFLVVRLPGWVAIVIAMACLGVVEASALTLTGVKSRKVHGTAGTWDLPVDASQSLGSALITIEPRAIGSGHKIVFVFDGTITSAGTALATDAFGPIGTVSTAITGASNMPANNEVSVTLAGIPDNKRVKVSVVQVNGVLDVEASLGFLVADVDNSRNVGNSDVSRVKARSGQAASLSTYVYDINASGAVNSSDISTVKARFGIALPAANEVALLLTRMGSGAGSVTSMPPGINCGSSCAANFVQNASVTLSTTPVAGSTFAGWSGGCSGGAASIMISLATNLTCTATFALIPTVVLAWDPVASANLSGYRVYFGLASGTYLQNPGQGLNAGMATTFTVSAGLNSGTRYYFVVRAYDQAGVESVNSNEVFRDIP